MDILLLHPPAVKPAEPPLGAAVLLAHLRGRGFSAAAIDANLGAYLHLLDPERLESAAGPSPSTAIRRAVRHAESALSLLRSPAALTSFARYSTAVLHLNKTLSVWKGGGRERLTLGDYDRDDLSPFSPGDLERLAAREKSTLFAGYFETELLPQVEALRPRLIALSVNYRHQVLPAFELAGLLRRRLPQVPVVGGGGVFTSWASTIRRLGLSFSCFSRIVFGPGEGPLAALAAGEAPGDYLLEGGADIAFLPDYGFARMADYFSPVPVLPVSASRGCYWKRCLFCPEAAAPTHPFALLPPASFSELLHELAGRYGARHFHFTDNALPIPVLRRLAAAAPLSQDLSWHGFVRFEKALLEPNLVEGLAASGCAMLQLGLESGSQRVLDRLRKGTRLEEVSAILWNLKRAGIASYVYVMLGTPGETEEDAVRTLRFLDAHAEAIGFLNLAIMNLPRGSGLLADPDEVGIAGSELLGEDEPLGLYRAFVPAAGWGRSEARRFLDQRLLASPAIRAIIQRTPPLFTSNHAFLFPPSST